MTRTSPPQLAFSSGEIDPILARRTDYRRWRTGMARCRGFLPMTQGAFTRGPGTLYRGRTRNDVAAALIPFVFAADDAAVIELTPNVLRVWRYGALVLAGAGPAVYELATPFGADSLPRLRWVQSADVIYIADGLQPVQRLARLALDNWTIGPLSLDRGPFRVQNLDTARTVTASGATGSVTLTASSALFTAQHVGSLLRLEAADLSGVALYTTNEPLTVGDIRRVGNNIYRLHTGTNSGENAPQHDEGLSRTDNSPTIWEFQSTLTGIVRITAVASATSATATVLQRLPAPVVGTPTYRWAEGAWSAVYGWPACLEILDQRLWAAATAAEPRTVWYSTVGDYADFSPGTEADSSGAFVISGSRGVNRIRNILRGRAGLHVFALGEEHSIRAEDRGQAIGPTNIVISYDSGIGSSDALPIAPDGDPIFISRDRRRVMLTRYALEADANRSDPLSLPSQHLGARLYEQIVWQGAPMRLAWLRRAQTGDLVAMLHEPSEEALGWAVLTLAGGFVEHAAVTPALDGTQDVVTLVVRRTVQGQTRRHIEDMAPIWAAVTGAEPLAEACHLFAAAVFVPPAPAATFSLPHLAGQSVVAWTDQGHVDGLTVAGDGAVTLPFAVSRATIGLFDASHEAETLDVLAATADGDTTGRLRRLWPGTGIGIHRSAAGQVAVVERNIPEDEQATPPLPLLSLPVGAVLSRGYTGTVRLDTGSGQTREVALRITPVGGAPLTITAVVPCVQEAGR